MFIPKYPEVIENACQLNIFIDYLVHGILDDLAFPIEFHGCKSFPSPCIGEEEVEILLKIPRDKSWVVEHIKTRITAFTKELIGRRCCLTLRNIRVNIIVQLLEPMKVAIKVEREDKTMFIPEVNEIRHTKSKRGEFFTVIWRDNTQTTVKLMEGDTSDEYTAYLYALGKKLFENKGEGRKFVREKKKVFEDRMAKKSAEKQRQRRAQALQQSLEAEDLPDISQQVYGEMFVAPCLISKSVFRRNR